ncbi:MAG: hypothetical protein OQK12_05800 [Motiliproteus sp.]|nr:hypothetical protein [Motiliproteus sp.]MCW9053509.1 hypothetical protein [Motiliproteus sp.]
MGVSVQITNHFKSSARINEENFRHDVFLEHFIAHGTVLQTLDSLGAEIRGTQQRTFTVTGPYGAGKSTLALFLDSLLSENKGVRSTALDKLGNTGGSKERFENNFAYEKGWKVVKHLCGLNAPVPAITESILAQLGKATPVTEHKSEAECLSLLKDAFDYASENYDGALIIVDELGKALDFQASVGGDLHFFQSFADLVQQYENILVIGFLHQSFAAYAKGRDSRTQNEWGKVQGRYKDFGFNPSIEESLYLIGESFKVGKQLGETLRSQSLSTRELVSKHFKLGNHELLANVLPIDPVVALLLGPISKRSFSQNERSLFSFIATHERFGFRDFVAKQTKMDVPFSRLYRIDLLWDYLYNNLDHIISASTDSKAWLEACDAVERASTYGDKLHSFIAKLVALLSMMGRVSGLFASKEFVVEYIESIPEFDFESGEVEQALRFLESKSIIIYRHNLNSYHVFRASDLDINRLVLDWIERVKDGLDWVSAYQSEKLVLANAHYHRTGVMRWAETQLVSHSEQVRIPDGKAGTAFVNFVLPTTPELYRTLSREFSGNRFLAIAKPYKIDELEAASVELIALEKLSKEEAEKLSRDPIAKTEIENREKLAVLQISKTLEKIFNNASWKYKGHQLSGKSLTAKVSKVADEIYPDCPSVQNELINRMKVSGTSNSALNKLMLAILLDDDEENLGLPVKTFPPEKGIYLSCLKHKGWHTPELSRTFAGDWFEVNDASKLPENHRDTYKIWKAGYEFIKASGELVVVKDLHDFWMRPPFGLTQGLCKLYTMALLKSLESHLAFYDFDSTKDWIYIPELDEELVNKLWRYPGEAGVRYYELEETDLSLVHEIAVASQVKDDESILATARALVRQMHAIPSWVKRTSGKNLFKTGGADHLDTLTKRFRDKVLSAKDPYKLILEDIPQLFSEGQDLSQGVRQCLDSLLEIDSIVAAQFRTTLLELLGASADEALIGRCSHVIQNASRPEIENFSKRVQQWSDAQSQQAFDELVALVIGVRKESWTDQRISEGYDKMRSLCVQFRRYETFSTSAEKATISTNPVSLIFKSKEGKLVELEQFVDACAEHDPVAAAVQSKIQENLSTCSTDQRVKLLMEMLAKEMLPVGGEV